MRLKRLYSGLLALGLSCSVLFQTPVLAAEETAADTAQAATSAITTNSIPGWPQGPEITSTAAVIMEDSTQTTLYSKNMDQELYPGATVKVMTVLVALENSQLTDEVTMTETVFPVLRRRCQYFRTAWRGFYNGTMPLCDHALLSK